MDIMRQSVCLVINPIAVFIYTFLFICTVVGQTPGLNDDPNLKLLLEGWWLMFVFFVPTMAMAQLGFI